MNINWESLFWIVGVIVTSNLVVLYTGYRYYVRILNAFGFVIGDLKIIHCEKCHRPEIVSKAVGRLINCLYCSGYFCNDCGERHELIDGGYVIPKEEIK